MPSLVVIIICAIKKPVSTTMYNLMERPAAFYIWGKFNEILKKIIRKDITAEETIFGMKCSIIKSREHLRNYITFAIRHAILISRAIEFDDPITGMYSLQKLKSF